MTGALGQPVFIIKQIYRLTTKMNCFIENNDLFFYVPPVIASTQLLTLMSIERYIAIKYPYNYHDIFTKHRLFGGILTAWFYALVVIQLNLIFPQNSSLRVSFSIFRILILILSLCMLVFCHVAVYHEAQKQIRKIRAQQLSPEAKETFLRENKALKTTRLVLGAALFTTLPHMFMRVVLSPRIGTSVMVFLLEAISLSIVFCNSLFNPLIYCIKTASIAQLLKESYGYDEIKCNQQGYPIEVLLAAILKITVTVTSREIDSRHLLTFLLADRNPNFSNESHFRSA